MRFIRYFTLWLALLLSYAAQAELVAIPPLAHRVTDLTSTLSADQQASLESKLQAFEQAKGSQIAILIIPTTQPEDIAQYSIRVVDQWKLGREKQDDGVLILVAKDDRKMRIEVGYGLEGAIPDAIAKRIVAEVMKPSFKQGDYYGGLDAAVTQISKLIDGEQLPPPAPAIAQNQADGGIEQYFVFLLFAAVVVGGILSSIFGRLMGSVATGGIIAFLVWLMTAVISTSIIAGFIALVFTLMSGGRGGLPIGGFGGGGFGRGGGGGFSGGGGGFGGGGASGDW
jgi:uncharacterized protein